MGGGIGRTARRLLSWWPGPSPWPHCSPMGGREGRLALLPEPASPKEPTSRRDPPIVCLAADRRLEIGCLGQRKDSGN